MQPTIKKMDNISPKSVYFPTYDFEGIFLRISKKNRPKNKRDKFGICDTTFNLVVSLFFFFLSTEVFYSKTENFQLFELQILQP